MPAITSLNPTTGAQGTLLRILGSDLGDCASVQFAGLEQVAPIAPSYVSPEEVRVVVPALAGAGVLAVSVLTAETESEAAEFTLTQSPAVASVFRLASIAALKAVLGVTPGETAADEKYGRLLDAASAAILRETGLDFRTVVIEDERYDGDGSSVLYLRRRPAVSVQGLRLSGTAIDPELVAVDDDKIVFLGEDDWQPRLRSTGYIFPVGRRNIAVDYTAGYELVPFDISQAAIEQAVFIDNTIGKAGIESETVSTTNTAMVYAKAPLALGVRLVCNRYRPTRAAIV